MRCAAPAVSLRSPSAHAVHPGFGAAPALAAAPSPPGHVTEMSRCPGGDVTCNGTCCDIFPWLAGHMRRDDCGILLYGDGMVAHAPLAGPVGRGAGDPLIGRDPAGQVSRNPAPLRQKRWRAPARHRPRRGWSPRPRRPPVFPPSVPGWTLRQWSQGFATASGSRGVGRCAPPCLRLRRENSPPVCLLSSLTTVRRLPPPLAGWLHRPGHACPEPDRQRTTPPEGHGPGGPVRGLAGLAGRCGRPAHPLGR